MNKYFVHNINWTRYFNFNSELCYISEANKNLKLFGRWTANLLSKEKEIIYYAIQKFPNNEIQLFDNLDKLACKIKTKNISITNEVVASIENGENIKIKSDKLFSLNSCIFLNDLQIGNVKQVCRNSFVDELDKEEFIIELKETAKTALIFTILANTIFSYTEYD